ncbi:MAG: phage BR0599 family protein [Patescibacteria group bacterium]|nr:phage BR0599 family protein [Patescibacteria group bacterium]
MKNITPELKAWLLTAPPHLRVELLEIALTNGQTLRAVAGSGADILAGVFDANTYYATAAGSWTAGADTSELMLGELRSNSVRLDVAAPSVYFPGTTTPMSQSFVTGAWDAAAVTITVLYFPPGPLTAANLKGSLVRFKGMVSDAQPTGRSKGTLTVQDYLYLANIQVPKRVIQPGCFNTFGDTACAFSLSSVGLANTVGAGSTPVVIVPGTAFPSTDARSNSISASYSGVGYFAGGKLKWTSGQNSGLYSHIQSYTGGSLVLSAAPPFAIATGDGFTAYAGCQKTLSDCKGRWANQANFAGFPFVPPPEHSA